MLKKTTLYIIMLVAGICLLASGIFFQELVQKSVQGVLLGLGAGLIGMNLANLYAIHIDKKNPHLAKRKEIEVKDERNTIIRNQAKAKAADITQWFVIGIAFITVLLNTPLWLTLVVVIVFLLYYILGICYTSKYQKEM